MKQRVKISKSEAESLFLELLEGLNSGEDEFSGIPLVLSKILRCFSFGCIFAYETDYKGVFHLIEHDYAYNDDPLPSLIKPEEFLSKSDREFLLKAAAVLHKDSGNNALFNKTLKLFGSKSLILLPIASQGKLLGIIGIADRRKELTLDNDAVVASLTALNIIANRIKLRAYQKMLKVTNETMQVIIDNSGIDIYVNDYETNEVLFVNKSMAEPYGGEKNLLGRKCHEGLHRGQKCECVYCPKAKLLDCDGKPTKKVAWDYERTSDGEWFRVMSCAHPWTDGRLAQIITSINITDRKRYEELITKMAFFDPLTGIANRRKLEHEFNEFVKNKRDKEAALIFLDLDDFKYINDTFGHQCGDELLNSIAEFLNKGLSVRGCAYRHGGDEFVLFFEGDSRLAKKVADEILARLALPWQASGKKMNATASLGIAMYPKDATSHNDLLGLADKAMYQAKLSGKGRAKYN